MISAHHLANTLLGTLIGELELNCYAEEVQGGEESEKDFFFRLFCKRVFPSFFAADMQLQAEAKQSLSYFLTRATEAPESLPEDFFERLLNRNMIAYQPGGECIQFYVWLWECLFPGEDFKMVNWQSLEVDLRT